MKSRFINSPDYNFDKTVSHEYVICISKPYNILVLRINYIFLFEIKNQTVFFFFFYSNNNH